jgi:hypothetical protein
VHILDWLLATIPKYSLDNQWNNTICYDAAKYNHLDVLIWARNQCPPCPWSDSVSEIASYKGNFVILKWLRNQNPPCPWNSMVCNNAIMLNRLDILQWARSQNPPCPWDTDACVTAARYGKLGMLKWIRLPQCNHPPCPMNEDVTTEAAKNGEYEILEWLLNQNPPCKINKKRCIFETEMWCLTNKKQIMNILNKLPDNDKETFSRADYHLEFFKL